MKTNPIFNCTIWHIHTLLLCIHKSIYIDICIIYVTVFNFILFPAYNSMTTCTSLFKNYQHRGVKVVSYFDIFVQYLTHCIELSKVPSSSLCNNSHTLKCNFNQTTPDIIRNTALWENNLPKIKNKNHHNLPYCY